MYERLESLAEEEELPEDVLREAKQLGFSDKQIGGAAQGTELAVRALREKHGEAPVVFWLRLKDRRGTERKGEISGGGTKAERNRERE